MIADLLSNPEFKKLEQEYKFLSRARGKTLKELEYVVLDIETTGLEPTRSEITEIGALKVVGNDIKDIYSSLIKPRQSISAEITKLTGIDDEMVKDFPPAEQVLPKFLEFIGDSILVAHNAAFDLPFIKHHAKELLNKEFNNQIACTLKSSRFLLPHLVNHKLPTVAEHFKLKVANRHRAMGDVELTYQIWMNFIDLLTSKKVNTASDLDALMSRL